MMVDTRIYGYFFDGWAACTSCASDEPYTTENGAVFHDGSHDHDVLECATGYCERSQGQGIFSHEDDGYGLTCDDCGDIIFETWPEIDHSEYGSHDDLSPEDMRDAECGLCTEYLRDHISHANDAHNLGAEQFEDDCDECATVVVTNDLEHDNNWHSDEPEPSCQWCRPRLAKSPGQEALGW